MDTTRLTSQCTGLYMLIWIPPFHAPVVSDSPFEIAQAGVGCGPAILNWAAEECSDDNEKRALVIAMGK